MSKSIPPWEIVLSKIKNSEDIPAKIDAIKLIENLLIHILIPPTMVIPYNNGYILEWHVENNKMFEVEIDQHGSFESFFYGFYKGVNNV